MRFRFRFALLNHVQATCLLYQSNVLEHVFLALMTD